MFGLAVAWTGFVRESARRGGCRSEVASWLLRVHHWGNAGVAAVSGSRQPGPCPGPSGVPFAGLIET